MSAFDTSVALPEPPRQKEAIIVNECDHETDGSKYSNKLIPRITISDNTSEVFCCEFSSDGLFLAAGCGDGAIRVFNAQVFIKLSQSTALHQCHITYEQYFFITTSPIAVLLPYPPH